MDVFANSKENKRTAIEELKNAMPEVKHEIKAIADDAKIKITKDMKIELLTDLLFEHTKKNDKIPINRKSIKDYLVRLRHLQFMMTGQKGVLDFEIYRNVDKVWNFIMNMKSFSGKSKGEELLFWNLIQEERITGYSHRAPSSRKNKILDTIPPINTTDNI